MCTRENCETLQSLPEGREHAGWDPEGARPGWKACSVGSGHIYGCGCLMLCPGLLASV